MPPIDVGRQALAEPTVQPASDGARHGPPPGIVVRFPDGQLMVLPDWDEEVPFSYEYGKNKTTELVEGSRAFDKFLERINKRLVTVGSGGVVDVCRAILEPSERPSPSPSTSSTPKPEPEPEPIEEPCADSNVPPSSSPPPTPRPRVGRRQQPAPVTATSQRPKRHRC